VRRPDAVVGTNFSTHRLAIRKNLFFPYGEFRVLKNGTGSRLLSQGSQGKAIPVNASSETVRKSDLWEISAKLRGIALLIQDQNCEEYSSDYGSGAFGVGLILIDLADQIRSIHEQLERLTSGNAEEE
jgi:hypothetical protein